MKLTYARTVKTLSLSALCLTFFACNGGSSGSTPAPAARAVASETATEANTASNVMTASGSARANSTVTSHDFAPANSGSADSVMTLAEILAAYPVLSDRAAFLSSIDRVVETDKNTLDLYSGNNLVMTLSYDASTHMLHVMNSTSGFAADSITLNVTASDQNQKSAISALMFTLSSCKAPVVQKQEQSQDKGQDKGQAQSQDKSQAQDKTPAPAAQDKGQDKGQAQSQDKSQAQETPKETPKVQEECASIEGTLNLAEVVQKQEQSQDKGQDKGQAQDKTPAPAAQDKGQDKGQAQDKTPAPAAQDKGQDKGVTKK